MLRKRIISVLSLLVIVICLCFSLSSAIAEVTASAKDNKTQFDLNPGETATLEIVVSSDSEVTYQWFLNVGGPAGKIIDGETGSQYTTGKAGSYRCRVYQDSKEVASVYFTVRILNELQAEAACETLFEYAPDKSITLSVTAGCNEGSLKYQWYKRSKSAGPGNVIIEGLTESSCTVNQDGDYFCEVSDEYGNSTGVWFTADTKTIIEAECGTEVIAEKGSTVTLKVNVTSIMKEITYEWVIERSGPPWPIEGATTNTLVIENVQDDKTYRCDIKDELGRYDTISISVKLGHPKTESIPGVAATCTSSGLTEGEKCISCGEIISQQVEIPALGHDWDEGKITKEPTYTENGIRTYTCRRCGETKTEDSSIKIHFGNTGWIQNNDGSWSYGDANGDAVVGSTNIGGVMYCFNEQGKMITGWEKVGGKWYYAESSGALAYSGWRQIGGTWYYFRASGEMATGWVNDDGTWYHMNARGEIETGWIKDKNSWFYFNKDGSMYVGWLKDGNSWYRLKADGSMVTGWYNDGGTWYYFKKSGIMAANEWVEDGGHWFWLQKNGVMATGQMKINGKIENFSSSGVWLGSGN